MTVTDLAILGTYATTEGYGTQADQLIWGLPSGEVRVHQCYALEPLTDYPADQPVLYFFPISHAIDRLFVDYRNVFIDTMYESTALPPRWAERLNRSRGVLTPSRFCKEVMEQQGVTVPIMVTREGIDPDQYTYQERPLRLGMTTLMVSTVQPRKNIDIGIAAWQEIFGNDPDARLFIKTSLSFPTYPPFEPEDPRILYVCAKEETRGLAHWYRQADVFMALGSEGFGIPLLEAMACGIPTIALAAAGQKDVCDEAPEDALLRVPAVGFKSHHCPIYGAGIGETPFPSVDDVAESLEWVASHRGEANDMGRRASDWIRANRSCWDKGTPILDFIREHSA